MHPLQTPYGSLRAVQAGMGEARHSCPAGLQGIRVMPLCSGGIISGPGSAPLPFVLPPPGRVRSACGTRSEFMRLHRTLSHHIRSGRPCPAGPGPSPAHAGGRVHMTPTFDPASMILASVAGVWPRDTPAFGLPCRDVEAGCLSDHASTQFVFHASDRRCRTRAPCSFFTVWHRVSGRHPPPDPCGPVPPFSCLFVPPRALQRLFFAKMGRCNLWFHLYRPSWHFTTSSCLPRCSSALPLPIWTCA